MKIPLRFNLRKGLLLFSFFSFLSIIPFHSFSQQADGILLKTENLNPVPNVKEWFSKSSTSRKASAALQVLLQFEALPNTEQRDQLKKSGIVLLDYVPYNTFIAIMPATAKPADVLSARVRSITDMKAEWKGEKHLWEKIKSSGAKNIELSVLFNRQAENPAIRNYIADCGGKIIPSQLEKRNCYKVLIPANNVKRLMDWYAVTYASISKTYIPLDIEANGAINATIVKAPLVAGGYGLQGDGVTIGVGDNVSGIYHIDLIDRIINYNQQGYTNHGQHINGIIGSAGIIDPKATGVVPHAILVDHFYDNVLATAPEMFQNHNMTITNNSYATNVMDTSFAGTYDQSAYLLDELSLDYKNVFHIFASGNDGFQQGSNYPLGYGTVTGGYQPAKNNIVVTNLDKKIGNVHEASRGPVRDGRLKPELSCIGYPVISTMGIDTYLVSGGTSMASPQAAGAAGLLTERYRQIFGNVNPRSDVLKTILLNGTYDIGTPGPDFQYGFGFLNLFRSIQILDSNWYTTNTINNGQQQTFTINVPPNTSQLKVMLYYHDDPASLASSVYAPKLVNDLDLEVEAPSSNVHKPLVLDPIPSNVLNPAVESVDHLNNCEQVTINNPAAGAYTIRIIGYSIPSVTRDYVVAYDFVPDTMQFKNPVTNTAVANHDSLCIYWDAPINNNTFTLEYSVNNGGNWTVLDNNIPADRRHYIWHVPATTSEQCKLRLTRNNTTQQIESGVFIINQQPVLTLDPANQCPGYIKVNWDPIPDATGYIIMRKKGFYMQNVDTVLAADTTYTLSGLSPDSTYYVAIQPIINGKPGFRSLAVKRTPNDGTCAGNISDGDLMIEKIVSPNSGRILTSTQLGTNETLIVRVRNLDDAVSGAYTIHYSVNNVWQTYSGSGIAANSAADISIPGLNLSAIGTYVLRAAIENTSATDNVAANDSATKTIRHLTNNVVSIITPFTDGFENTSVTVVKRDSLGISSNDHWDYASSQQDSGRLRTYVNDSFLISGSRSVTMDLERKISDGVQNYLVGTFNLSNIDTASEEVRMDFDYMIHGRPKFYEGNEVWVRGSDIQPWIPLFHYDTTIHAAQVVSSGSLSLTQALRTNGQNYSSSTQIRFGQRDTSLVASNDYGNGMTIDNFKLYMLQKDMQLLSILSPLKTDCGLADNLPVIIKIYNSVSQVQNNVQVSYRFDNGPVVSDIVSSIPGYDTVDYTFAQTIVSLSPGAHTLSVWLSAPGDDFLSNDSIMNVTFHNQPLITTFPFLENFEGGDGFWYHEGVNDSWEYGTPNGNLINTAASGSKAWVTNLDGNYNNMELSYLYTTCFNISSLTMPKLSFKLITDIENCDPLLCDAAYLEYSHDNVNWTKLGSAGQGSNWYDSAFNVWNRQDTAIWREAIISLPASTQPIRFRYVFASDPGASREGIGIDDFRIYDDIDTTVAGEPFEGMVIFPNPSNVGYLTVKWSAEPGTKMQAVITDVAGRVVFKGTTTASAKVNLTNLNTGRYMTGIYFVKLIIGEREYVEKVLFTQ